MVWHAAVEDPTANLEYQFWLYTAATGSWSLGKPYSSANTFSWTPQTGGNYAVQAWARQVGSATAYEVYRGTSLFEIIGPPQVISLTADKPLPSSAGTPITWTALASGGTAPLLYQFWLRDGVTWVLAQDYSSSNTWTWTPAVAGEYALQVWVRSSGSAAPYEAYRSSGVFTIQP